MDGVVEVDHGALYVSTETSQCLACDASLVRRRVSTTLVPLSRRHHRAVHEGGFVVSKELVGALPA